MELASDATDYLECGSFQEEEFSRNWRRLQPVFETAPHKLTRLDVCRRWPHDKPPDKISLRRLLERAVDLALLRKDGAGLRGKPFRYWLPQQEEVWRQDPLACLLMPELATDKMG
jgi:hypothetical protein